MQKIERNQLANVKVAGGCCKAASKNNSNAVVVPR